MCGLAKCLADGHHCANIVLAAGFLAGGSRQEKASVRLPCSGKKLAANNWLYAPFPFVNG